MDSKSPISVEVPRGTQVTARDRILLACHGLTWMASQVETVASHLAMLTREPVLTESAAEHRRYLDGIADRLASALEDLGDYCNAVDAVTDLDEFLFNPVFDLLHGGDAAEPDAPSS